MKYHAYYDDDGRIIQRGIAHDESAPPDTSQNIIETTEEISKATHYVSSGSLESRPIMGSGMSLTSMTIIDTAVLSGTVTGAVVRLERVEDRLSPINDNFTELISDGTDINITADTPGDYVVRVNLWPYQEEVFDLAVTDV